MKDPLLDLTIIIPNYNTRELLRQCIASIYEYTEGISFEVICIDDSSRDGSADIVATEFKEVVLVRNSVNQLYVRNNNLGMRMSRARYACLLNSDTKLISNAFQALVTFMDEHPDVAACGPKLLNPDLSVQHCIRRFVGARTLIMQGLNWHKLFPRNQSMRRLYATDFDYAQTQQVDSIGTTAFVIRRSTWEQAGVLDERFQLFVVDWAYNYMLKAKGFKVYYTSCAEIIHFGSQSVNQTAANSIRALHEALIQFSESYDYFGKSRMVKWIVRIVVALRCQLKLLEYRLGSDKRVIKGPGAPPKAPRHPPHLITHSNHTQIERSSATRGLHE
jgi:GT2 family glycosyltransferase